MHLSSSAVLSVSGAHVEEVGGRRPRSGL